MKNLIKNKKADIPIVILVLGILASCTLIFLLFINNSQKLKDSFVGPGIIETILSYQEEANYDEMISGGKFKEIVEFSENAGMLSSIAKLKINHPDGHIQGEVLDLKGKMLVSVEYLYKSRNH